jgi:hypothetical protein
MVISTSAARPWLDDDEERISTRNTAARTRDHGRIPRVFSPPKVFDDPSQYYADYRPPVRRYTSEAQERHQLFDNPEGNMQEEGEEQETAELAEDKRLYELGASSASIERERRTRSSDLALASSSRNWGATGNDIIAHDQNIKILMARQRENYKMTRLGSLFKDYEIGWPVNQQLFKSGTAPKVLKQNFAPQDVVEWKQSVLQAMTVQPAWNFVYASSYIHNQSYDIILSRIQNSLNGRL